MFGLHGRISEAAPQNVEPEPGQKNEQNKLRKKTEVFVMARQPEKTVVRTAQVQTFLVTKFYVCGIDK